MGALKNVIPAKAGIQKLLKLLDPRFRGDDKAVRFSTLPFCNRYSSRSMT